jgi:hypothetical protein
MHTVVIFLAHGCSEAINLADIILAAAGVVAGRVVDALNTHTHTHTHTQRTIWLIPMNHAQCSLGRDSGAAHGQYDASEITRGNSPRESHDHRKTVCKRHAHFWTAAEGSSATGLAS